MKIRQGFVEVEGHRLAYLAVNEHLARADEPAVVFIHGGVPGTKIVVFQDVGHMPFIESADACARALEAAIDDLSRRLDKREPASP